MAAPNVSEASIDEGNTSHQSPTTGTRGEQVDKSAEVTTQSGKRDSSAKYWCFTVFGMCLEDIARIVGSIPGIKYVISHEMCPTSGRVHLQGFIVFYNKCRPMEKYRDWKAHWEKCRGKEIDNVKYCSKEGRFIQKGFDKYFQFMREDEVINYIEDELEEKRIKPLMKNIGKIIYRLMFVNKRIKPIKTEAGQKEYVKFITDMVCPKNNFNWME